MKIGTVIRVAIGVLGSLAAADVAAFPLAATSVTERGPDVAWRSGTNDYIVVWESAGAIRGEIRRSDGTVVRPAFDVMPRVSGVTYSDASVTLASAAQYYVVAKQTIGKVAGVVGRVVTSTGVVGAETSIVAGYHVSQLPGRPTVAGAPSPFSANRLLVAWATPTECRAQLLTASGTLLGGTLMVNAASGGAEGRNPVATADAQGFWVVTSTTLYTVSYVSAVSLGYDGRFLRRVQLASAVDASDPDVAYHPGIGKTVAVWRDGQGIFGAQLPASGYIATPIEVANGALANRFYRDPAITARLGVPGGGTSDVCPFIVAASVASSSTGTNDISIGCLKPGSTGPLWLEVALSPAITTSDDETQVALTSVDWKLVTAWTSFGVRVNRSSPLGFVFDSDVYLGIGLGPGSQ